MYPLRVSNRLDQDQTRRLVGLDQSLMGESFQDYSWIQDFEADLLQKVSLKILN